MVDILKNKLTRTLMVSLLFSTIVALIMVTGFLNTWELRISDAFYAPSEPLDDIVIVAIDDNSFRELGMLPWPRNYYASVIENLNQSAVIGIDVIFDLATNAENDSALAEAFKTNNIVLAMEFTDFSYNNGELYGGTLIKPNATLGTPGVDFETGFVNLYQDSDGVIRSFPTSILGIEDHNHFSKVIVGEYTGVIPEMEESRMLINFFTKPGGYEYISFSDVYNKRTNPSYFYGKIVLIGVTSPVEHDDYTVPISNNDMPGVEINANIVQSILTRDYIYYQDDISTTIVIFIFALLTGILLYAFKMHIATVFVGVISTAFIFFSIIYTFNSGIIVNILYPLLSITGVYIPIIVLYYLTEEKNRKWITSIFGKYVSPLVIDNLLKNPDKLKLGGETRNLTIFFSDIRGFTQISERIDPKELVHLLNEYLTEMTSIIIMNQGLVDKYMGDAIMAFWGAPLEQIKHAEMACSSSLEMLDKLRELQKKWESEGIPSFDIGMGINTGIAIVGNMGSLNRFDYTAIGDNVNLASRMEGLNKYYGTNIIITENTQNIVKDKFETRKLDVVRVKGKKKQICIYELLSRKDKLSKKQREFVGIYEEGLEFYFNTQWEQAIKSFRAAIDIIDDNAARLFINRCQKFLKKQPPKNWDGVWEMEIK